MQLSLPKQGTYVLAVSGGVDSVCLLDILAHQDQCSVVVAHFDHGIRSDSANDASFVAGLAKSYGLPFYLLREELGAKASEALARERRYRFLEEVRHKIKAEAIMTAHHQDDKIETCFINLWRGSGRLGMTSLTETEQIRRPLLNVSKAEIHSYALVHRLQWHEDSTNSDPSYLRNYLRQQLIPKLTPSQRQRLIELIDSQTQINTELDSLLRQWANKERLLLHDLTSLRFNEAKELVAAWLRYNKLRNFNRKAIERLTLAALCKAPSTRVEVYDHWQVIITEDFLALERSEC